MFRVLGEHERGPRARPGKEENKLYLIFEVIEVGQKAVVRKEGLGAGHATLGLKTVQNVNYDIRR